MKNSRKILTCGSALIMFINEGQWGNLATAFKSLTSLFNSNTPSWFHTRMTFKMWKSLSIDTIKMWSKSQEMSESWSWNKETCQAKSTTMETLQFPEQSNLIFPVISAASNASQENFWLSCILVSMPRQINHRPMTAGVTHINPLVHLAQHQAAGAPPQSHGQ